MVIPIKPPSLVSFFRLGLGGGMEPTNEPQQTYMPHSWEPPSSFSVFLSGRRQPPNSTGHRRPRPACSPSHDLHRVSPVQRGYEYNKAIAFHGPKILKGTIQNSVYSLYCIIMRSHLEYATEANALFRYQYLVRFNITSANFVRCNESSKIACVNSGNG